jgi:hypothetical protein
VSDQSLRRGFQFMYPKTALSPGGQLMEIR